MTTNSVWLSTNEIVFGDTAPGLEWGEVEYRVPAPFEQAGKGCFAQFITADRHLWRTVTNQQTYTHFIKDWWNGIEALDAAFPYPTYGPNSSVWTLPNKGYAYDTPRQPLSWSSQHTQY